MSGRWEPSPRVWLTSLEWLRFWSRRPWQERGSGIGGWRAIDQRRRYGGTGCHGRPHPWRGKRLPMFGLHSLAFLWPSWPLTRGRLRGTAGRRSLDYRRPPRTAGTACVPRLHRGQGLLAAAMTGCAAGVAMVSREGSPGGGGVCGARSNVNCVPVSVAMTAVASAVGARPRQRGGGQEVTAAQAVAAAVPEAASNIAVVFLSACWRWRWRPKRRTRGRDIKLRRRWLSAGG